MPSDLSLNNLLAKHASKDPLTDAIQQRDRLKKATQEFESVFIGQLIKEMRKTESGDPLLGKSRESKQFQEMSDDALARNLSKSGSFGLSKVLYGRMEKWLPPIPKAQTVPPAEITPEETK